MDNTIMKTYIQPLTSAVMFMTGSVLQTSAPIPTPSYPGAPARHFSPRQIH